MNAHPPRLFDPARDGWAAVRLGLLMIASAVTEGVGIVLLVPLLATLSGGGSGQIGAVFAAIGLPQRLDVLLGAFVALIALRAGIAFARGLAAVRFEFRLVDGLRARAWQALLDCEWRVLLEMRRADSASLLITEVDRTANAISQVIQAAALVVTLLGIALAALAISPAASMGAVLGGALVMFAYRGLRQRAGALGMALGQAYGRIHARLHDGLGALRVIKSSGSEQRSAAEVLGEFAGLRAAQTAYVRDSALGHGVLQFSGAAVLAGLTWLAVTRWQIGVPRLLPLVALFARALPLLAALQQSLGEFAHARPAVNNALALIARAEAAREPHDESAAAPIPAETITLDTVSLRFGAAVVLDQVSLDLPARGLTMLTGASGAGKSTLADVLGGLLAPDGGTLRIDGVALDPAQRRAWRRNVGYVQQDPVLLAASVRDNLLWAAPEATEAALQSALEDAAASFVFALPGGLDTLVGDGGRALSGGERQRLMLARALLRRPALLILDEATSALDAENEAQIAAALARLKGRMAVLVIAHRGALSAIADRTYTLAAGRMVKAAT